MKLKLPFQKLTNQRGFGHVELVLAVAFIAVFAFVGVRVLNQSHAATVGALTSTGCSLRGRVWSGSCTKTCQTNAGSHVVANTYDYCSSAVSTGLSATTCASYGRVYLTNGATGNNGCARRWQQTNLKGAIQCTSSTATYTVSSSYDKCSSTVASGPYKVTCSVAFTYTGAIDSGSNDITSKIVFTNSGGSNSPASSTATIGDLNQSVDFFSVPVIAPGSSYSITRYMTLALYGGSTLSAGYAPLGPNSPPFVSCWGSRSF